MLGRVETVRVVREGSRLGYHIINRADFDPARHVEWVDPSDRVFYPSEDRPVVDPRPAATISAGDVVTLPRESVPVRRLGRRI